MQVFVWFGVNSTEIEKKLAVKSAQVCTAILWNATYDVPVPDPPLSHTHTHTHTHTHRSTSITCRVKVRNGN